MIDPHQDFISGAKGGDPQPYNEEDNLDSTATAKILDVLSEGEIGGFATPFEKNISTSNSLYPIEAKKDIFFNQTPLLKPETEITTNPHSVSKDYNFDINNLKVDSRTGLGDQTVINMFDQVRTTVQVSNLAVPKASPRSITVQNATAPNNISRVLVVLNFPQLYKIEDDGDTRGVKVSYKIFIDNVEKISSHVKGRTNDLYQKQHEIDTSDKTGDFVIKVERLSNDTPSSDFVSYQGSIIFASYTKIIDQSLKYNDTALVGIQADAKQFSSIPNRTYKIKGTKIRIPGTGADGSTPTIDKVTGRIIYDAGYIFNGTMQAATFCSCPVFVLYDILTAKRYGYGHQILTEEEKLDFSSGNATNVDLYSFVTASKYSNTLVFDKRDTTGTQTGTWTRPENNNCILITCVGHKLQSGDKVNLTFTSGQDSNGNPSNKQYEVITNGLNSKNEFKVLDAGSTISDPITGTNNVTIVKLDQEPRFSFNSSLNKQEEGFNLINNICSNFRARAYWSEGKVKIVQDKPSDSVYLFGRSNVTEEGFSYSGSDIKTRPNLVVVRYFSNNQQKIDYVQYPARENVATDPYVKRYGLQKKQINAFGCTSAGQAARLARWVYYTSNLLTETVSFTTTPDAGVVLRPGMVISISDPVRSGSRYAGRITYASSTVITVDAAPVNSVASGDKLSVILPNGTVETKNVGSITGTSITVEGGSSFSSPPQSNSVWMYERTTVEPTTWRVVSIKETESIKYEIAALKYESSIYNTIETGSDITVRDITDLDETPSAPTTITATESLYKKVAKPGSTTNTGTVAVQLRFSWPTVPGISQYKVEYVTQGVDDEVVDPPIVVPVRTNEIELRDVVTHHLYTVKVYSISSGGKISSTPALLENYSVTGKSAPPSPVGTITPTIDKNDGVSLSWVPIVAVAPNWADLDLAGYEVRKAAAPNQDGSYTWTNASHPITNASNKGLTAQTNNVLIPIEHVKTTTTYLVKAYDDSGNLSVTPTSVTQTITAPAAVQNLTAGVAKAGALDTQGMALIEWSAPALPSPDTTYALSYYIISYTDSSSQAVEERIDATHYIIPANWSDSQVFTVKAVDVAGNVGASTDITLTIPEIAAPETLTSSLTTDSVLLKWTAGTTQSNELPLKAWKVLRGTDLVATLKSTELLLPVTYANFPDLSDTTYTVKAIDINGKVSANSKSISIAIANPSQPGFNDVEYELDFIKLSWNAPSSSLPIIKYLLYEQNANDTTTDIALLDTTSFNVRWSKGITSRTFKVKPLTAAYLNASSGTHQAHFTGTVGSITCSRSYISAPSSAGSGDVTLDVLGGSGFVTIKWVAPTINTANNLDLKDYKVIRSSQTTYGAAKTDGNAVTTYIDSNSFKEGISWAAGTMYYYIVSRDILGDEKDEALQITVTIDVPSEIPNANGTEVIDNNVLLRWAAAPVSSTQLKIDHYIIKKFVGEQNSASWTHANAEEIGIADARFSVVFENVGGTYTYLIKAVDVAGNESANAFKTEQIVAQPPDFILNVDHVSTFNSTLAEVSDSTFSNCLVLNDSSLGRNVAYMPIETDSNGNHTETWGTHFIGTGSSSSPQYANMQALITAGYTGYLQGNSDVTEGYYNETYNYGTNLASSKVTQHIAKTAVGSGATANSLRIDITAHDGSFSGDANGSYVSGQNSHQRHGTTFGKVRYWTKITTSNGGVAKIDTLNLRLDGKTKNDTGSGTANDTDSGGTTVNFNVSFIDVQGIVVTPKTTNAVLAVVNFTDEANPTSFKVLLYNTSGTRVDGDFTWSARGI